MMIIIVFGKKKNEKDNYKKKGFYFEKNDISSYNISRMEWVGKKTEKLAEERAVWGSLSI